MPLRFCIVSAELTVSRRATLNLNSPCFIWLVGVEVIDSKLCRVTISAHHDLILQWVFRVYSYDL